MSEFVGKGKDVSMFNGADERAIRAIDVILNHNNVFENTDGAVVGLLDTVDTDSNGSYTYSLQNHQDTFEIVSGELRVKDGVTLDYETANAYKLNILATDTTGKTIDKSFTINVLNEYEGVNNITGNDKDRDNDDLPYFIRTLFKSSLRSHAGTTHLWGHDESDQIGGRNPLKFDRVEDFIGKERKLVYGFGNGEPAYTEAQKASVHKAMQYYHERFGLKVEFNDNIQDANNDADIVFYRKAYGDSTAANTVTGGIAQNGHVYWAASNKIYMDTGHYPDSNDMSTGGFRSLLHEIGHAVGLKHPFTNSGNDDTLDGYGHHNEQNTDNTVMAYHGGSRYWSHYELSHFDVAILEYMYGLNDSYKSGNNVYKYGNQKILSDGSGNDTIDATAVTDNLTINLNSGSWSYTGETKNDSILADGQLFIGYDTVIENLKAGSGNDYITGNRSVANHIFAGAGNDIVNGGSGEDYFYGEDGNDALKGGAGDDVLDGGKGDDILDGGAGNDTLDGGAGNDILNGGDGNDTLNAGTGIDTINGGNGDDTIFYNEGMNSQGNTLHGTINGGAGVDTLKILSSVAYNYGNSWDVNNVKNVEIFDMQNNGREDDSLSLWAADAYYANPEHTLIIDKDTTDTVNFVQGAKQVESDKEGYELYITNQGRYSEGKVYISAGKIIKGSSQNETLNGTDGDDTLYYNESMNPQGNVLHGSINGGKGVDTLKILSSTAYNYGNSWDINNVKNVEIFDMQNNGRENDSLSLWGADAYSANPDHTLIIDKDTYDTVKFVQGAKKVESDKEGYDLYITNQGYSTQGKVYISQGTIIKGSNRSETLNGTDDNDVINSYGGNDIINGNGGKDHIYAGNGNDTIYYNEAMNPQGNTPHGTIDGGAGMDTLKILSSTAYNYRNSWDINNVKNVEIFDMQNNGREGDSLSLWAADAYYANPDHTLIIDKDTTDSVNFVQGAKQVESDREGYDLYITNQGRSSEGKVYVSAGKIINGNNQSETLNGSSGDDVINGNGGNDKIYAGSGDDVIYYDESMNLQGDTPHGSIDGGAGTDTLKILSSAGYNYGNSWDINNVTDIEIIDMQNNGREGDNLSLWGADAYSANPNHTLIINKDRGDKVQFVNTTVRAESDKEGYELYITDQGSATEGKVYITQGSIIDGNNNSNTLNGTGGKDDINGNDGNDTLNGRAGNDVLNGGAGADKMYGGAGDDILVYDGKDTVVNGEIGIDTIRIAADTTGNENGGRLRIKNASNNEIVDMNNGSHDDLEIWGEDVFNANSQHILIVNRDRGNGVNDFVRPNGVYQKGVSKASSSLLDGYDEWHFDSHPEAKLFLLKDPSKAVTADSPEVQKLFDVTRSENVADDDNTVGYSNDVEFTYTDTGAGFDTLKLNPTDSVKLDFDSISSKVKNIEEINMEDNAIDGDKLTIDVQDVLEMTDSDNELFIKGDSNDTVELDNSKGEWQQAESGKEGYMMYTNVDNATLYIDTDVNSFII